MVPFSFSEGKPRNFYDPIDSLRPPGFGRARETIRLINSFLQGRRDPTADADRGPIPVPTLAPVPKKPRAPWAAEVREAEAGRRDAYRIGAKRI